MLDYLLNKIPFQKTIIAAAALFSVLSCSPEQAPPQNSHTTLHSYAAAAPLCEKKAYASDKDLDGAFDKKEGIYSGCTPPWGFVAWDKIYAEDCNDTNASINPNAEEICNAIDDNCDGITDYILGVESCGGEGDCEEFKTVRCINGKYKDFTECTPINSLLERCNYLDDDCNGLTDEIFSIGEHCYAGFGVCKTDGIIDCAEDGSTTCIATSDLLLLPEEVCNNQDDDCDGLIDDGLTQTCYSICGEGTETCVWGAWYCDAPQPTPELCGDGIDNDCDGLTDKIYDVEYSAGIKLIPLLDNSGSMSTNDLDDNRFTAVEKLCDYLKPQDQVKVAAFADIYKSYGSFTGDKAAILAQVLAAKIDIYLGSGTNIDEATVNVVNDFPAGGKSDLIIIVTDGGNGFNEEYDVQEANTAAINKGVTICALALGVNPDLDYLAKLTANGVGKVVPIGDIAHLETVLQKIVIASEGGQVKECDENGNLVVKKGLCSGEDTETPETP